ncbi:MAG: Response regulator containing a CheY-like receiver domain and an DNA-binding domain [Frankiales bacterium]|nr:Response regulator containing a CheY-like receiver domain and an DNA-binding domain [Frankiales bacterium]
MNDLHLAEPDDLSFEVDRVRFEAEQALSTTLTSAFVMMVPTKEIIASSPSVSLLLDPDGGSVVGRNFEEFTADGPTGALALFAQGRLSGYDAVRVLRRRDGADIPVRLWVHRYGHQPPTRYALVLLDVESRSRGRQVDPESMAASLVAGTVDGAWQIERISGNAEQLFGAAVAELIGIPLAQLISAGDAEHFLASLAAAATGQHSIIMHVDIRSTQANASGSTHCEVVLIPLQPNLGCGFVFLSEPTNLPHSEPPTSVAAMLRRLDRAVDLAALTRTSNVAMTEADLPGLAKLSARELQIVARLLEGDRVPAIAAELFLSPSTVRTHLAVVYGKLNVSSQQDLLSLVRDARKRSIEAPGDGG